ncbi:MAG: ABC transporter ATP-binding protein [Cohaesibacteraceae bacterium]|nr:ABC transporter ATP-binding protein [Cohaesibacteraceae bacterium]
MQNLKTGSIHFRGVEKKFGSVTALKQLDLSIEPGQLVTLLGPSGCGKTTTLRLIAGLESPTNGSIHIGQKDVTHLSASYRKVSMVFQSYALFPHMSVLENVAYGLTVKSIPKKQVREKVEQGLKLVGLDGFGQRLPSELSGGQQQRVAVARAIVLEPEVLLLDEPLSNLDAKLRRRVREEIRQIQQDLGLTTVYVTHDQEEAMAVSDRIIVMRNAEIAQEGTPNDLYERPNSAFIADFIGDANLINCEITASTDTHHEVEIASRKITIPKRENIAGAARLVLRPHQLRLTNRKHSAGFDGTIVYAAYLGNQVQYTIDGELGQLFAVCEATANPFTIGNDVKVDFDCSVAGLVPA